MQDVLTYYVVKTSIWRNESRNAVICRTYNMAWLIANAIDSDHAQQLIDELPVVEPVPAPTQEMRDESA